MNIFGLGTFFTGESGIGKSELALALLDRGHQLIADDVVECHSDGKTIQACAPDLLKNFLEVRGLGVIDVPSLFGPDSTAEHHSLSLVIHLEKMPFISRDISKPNMHVKPILGIPVPHIILSVVGRTDLRVETIVRNQMKGMEPHLDFIQKQRIQLGKSA